MVEEIPQANKEKNETKDTETKIRTIVDELLSEKEQGLIEQITDSVKSEVKNIVQEELHKEEGNPEDKGEPQGESTGNTNKSVVKSFKPEQIQEMISKSITDAFGDFEDKFFKNLNEGRAPEPHVTLGMKCKIIVFFQEDRKETKKYHILDTEAYLKGKEKVIKKDVNSFLVINQELANVDFSQIRGSLSAFNFKSKDNFIKKFDGIFHLVTICVTANGAYSTAYIAVETPLGMVQHTVNCQAILTGKNTVDFVKF